MRKTINFGIGIATAGIIATMAAGVASATTGGQQAAGSVAAATSSVNRHITKAQARHIATAKVPHSRVIEVESDDLHNRAVWKVKLATPHGRVVVDVDKRTGQATIVQRGGGHDDAIAAGRIAGQVREAGDDRGAGEVADDHGRDFRDDDGAGEDRGDHGDRHGQHHDRGDQHDHDRGDDGPGR